MEDTKTQLKGFKFKHKKNIWKPFHSRALFNNSCGCNKSINKLPLNNLIINKVVLKPIKLIKQVNLNNPVKQIKPIQKIKLKKLNFFNQITIIRPNKPNNYACTKYAVLVGINYYASPPNRLNGCINDMNNLNKFILTKNFKPENIVLLSDDKGPIPTKSKILSELTKMLQKAKSGDTCMFSYSGHGGQLTDRNKDEDDGLDECLYSCNLEEIKDDEIKSIIQKYLKSGVKLFCLMDCCHSGTILDLRYNYKYNTTLVNYENIKQQKTSGEVYMISGCMDSQVSMDAYLNGKYAGAMTYSFLKCINSSKTWDNLLTNMRSTLKKESFDQIVQLSSGRPLNINSSITIFNSSC